jgi:hypothetical protein
MMSGDEIAAGSPTTPQLVPKLIRAHCMVIDEVARSLRGQGKLVITGFGEDPDAPDPKTGRPGCRLPPKIVHVGVGDIDQAVERICQIANLPHYNVYMPIAVFQHDLQPGRKGYERDVAACLGLVADFDDPEAARWADRLPVPPNCVLETSAGRFQAFYLFRKPELLEAVKPVAERLKAYAECDHGTSDISHVWRIPGTLNWPNAKKVGEGRSREPQQVQVVEPFTGKTISLQNLRNALLETSGDGAGKKRARTKQSRGGKGQPNKAAIEGTEEQLRASFAMLFLPDDLKEEIRHPVDGDRSKAIFKVIPKLIDQGLDDQTIEDIIYAHPKGIGEKYANRNDLDREIARVRKKTASKPVIQIRGGALPEIVDEAEQHLIEAGDNIFQRGSVIVRPGQTVITVADGHKIFATRLVPVRVHHMVERFSRVIDFQKLDMRSDTWLSINCPRNIAETYLEREGQWRLPVLTGVISAPTLRPDGSVLEVPGYDRATGLLFDTQNLAFPPVPKAPTKDDAIGALNELKSLIQTFPFVDGASLAVALSAIVTALIRPSLVSAPLHAYTAPAAGSGKSLLVDIASVIATGRETAVLAQGRTAEEFEKRIGAAFLAGDGTISIDNCEQPLGGELLCQVLTQPSVNIRVLGQSRNVEVLTNTTLFATGNNLRIVGDMTRRALVCSLDPKCERPELRRFSVDPIAITRRDRGRYVVAALTMLRAFHIAGRPQQTAALGSFEMWWVRDALIWLGETDPCETIERVRTQDPELEKLRGVIHHWSEAIGAQRVSAAQAIEIATDVAANFDSEEAKLAQHELREALSAVAGIGNTIDPRRLGNWLSRNKDRIVDGMVIVLAGLSAGFNQWQLARVE